MSIICILVRTRYKEDVKLIRLDIFLESDPLIDRIRDEVTENKRFNYKEIVTRRKTMIIKERNKERLWR